MKLELELPKVFLSFLSIETAQVASHIGAVLVSLCWATYLGLKIRRELQRAKIPVKNDETNPPV